MKIEKENQTQYSEKLNIWYTQESNSIIVNVYVQPGAKCTEIVGLHGDALKIRLTSRPIDGGANEALLKYIAQLFEVPLRQVKLIQGDKSRQKKLVITGSKIEPLLLLKHYFC